MYKGCQMAKNLSVITYKLYNWPADTVLSRTAVWTCRIIHVLEFSSFLSGNTVHPCSLEQLQMFNVIIADCIENLTKHRNDLRDQNSVFFYVTVRSTQSCDSHSILALVLVTRAVFQHGQYHIAKFRNREQSDVIPQALASQVQDLMISSCTVSNRCLPDT
jgi:hypothetical protein